MNLKILLVISLSLGLSNCASITGENYQPINLTAKDDKSNAVEGANCVLVNDKGSWEGKTPSFVNITRSAEDMSITCKKAGMQDGLVKAVSRARGSMWGNIVFGGGVGALIDHSKGTGYAYPDQIQIIMGKSRTLDRDGTTNTPQ
jgi:uncharacterized protein YfiM (DUF2279 family)